MESPECDSCPLFIQRREHRIPSGCELAWHVHERLSGPAVTRFNLYGDVLASMNLSLSAHDSARLIDQLNAIVSGLTDAGEIIAESKRKKK